MTNKDLHSLYSIFDLCNEITFTKTLKNKGLGLIINDNDFPANRNNRQKIADTLFELDLRALNYFLTTSEAFSIFRCKDDNALKFTLTLVCPGTNLSENGSIIIDSNIPHNDEDHIFFNLMVRMKTKLATSVIKELNDHLEKKEGGCYAR